MDLELGTENLRSDLTECCLCHIASPCQQLEKTCAAAAAGMDMDMDLELGTENLCFDPTDYGLWYIASPGQQLEKKFLYFQQVADRFCLTTRDLDTLLRVSAAEFYFRQINNSLLLSLGPLTIIWNNSVCYVLHDDNIPSIRFLDFVIASESWVSSGLHFDNSLVIQAALRLIYEGLQDKVQELRSDVEDCWCFSRTLCDLREWESRLSSVSEKVIVDIFDSGSPGWVAVFLEPKQLQECLNPWNSIPEQLDSIRAMLNKKRRKFENMMVLMVVFGLLMVALQIPLCRVFVYVFLVAVVLMRWFISMGLF